MKKETNNKGITLIALVITIIVLLILAGIAISMLSGENGILRQAAKAKKSTEEQSTIEQIKLAVTSAITNEKHKIDMPTLNDELVKIGYDLGQDEENRITELPANIEMNKNHYVIGENGSVFQPKWYENENGAITNAEGQVLKIGDEINYDASVDANGNTVMASVMNKNIILLRIADIACFSIDRCKTW